MFHKDKDPITRVGLGIIGAVGVVLIIVAAWDTFAPEAEPVAEQVALAEPDGDEGDGEALPQVSEEEREGGINEIGDSAEPPEGGVDEAAEAPFVEGTEVADAPVTEGEEAAAEEIAAEDAPPPLEVGNEALTADAADEGLDDAEEEVVAGDAPPPLEVDGEAVAAEATDEGVDAVVAEEDTAAADAPPPLEVGDDAQAESGAAAGGEAEFSEEGMALLTADAEAGARVWNQCRACHVADQEQNRVGPHLVDIVGREVASVDGFRYSDALQNHPVEQWTPEELDAWLTDPRGYAPGTTMAYSGLRNPEDRANLLTYLYELHQGQ